MLALAGGDGIDPERFAGSKADIYGWIPFGGGVRRCIGASFASLEMRVVLRTILRDFVLEPTTNDRVIHPLV